MSKEKLDSLILTNRLYTPQRNEAVALILDNPETIPFLLQTIFKKVSPGDFNAAWVLDNVLRKNLSLILPHLDSFCTGLKDLQSESTIRPMAKICESLAFAYFEKKNENIQQALTTAHLERISEICFDWLIGEHKMAAKVFSMTALLYTGRKFKWIHPELKQVLELQYAAGSVGFKNRAGKTLDALQKHLEK